MLDLAILACGAVTAAGLDAFQTAAAIRAHVTGFSACIPLPPPDEPLLGARVPAGFGLRKTENDWLVNLSARAIRQVLQVPNLPRRLGLMLALPEAFRRHPGCRDAPEDLVRKIELTLGWGFERAYLLAEGSAGALGALEFASELIRDRVIEACLIGGVDSLLNQQDIGRLRSAKRIHEPKNPQGVIPGEGAAILLVGRDHGRPALARVLGAASEREINPANGNRYSQGHALLNCMKRATAISGLDEPALSMRVSSMNGERYAAWESAIAVPRFYRSRREHLTNCLIASSVGDIGAASGALAAAIASIAIAAGYASGPNVICEAASEDGLRAACVIAPAIGAAPPPFRPEEGTFQRVNDILGANRAN